ncbi:hypothetical protein lerEdw1_010643 [Lerista edwardsae]|nr:hypothetical protein lerEdw1_010643 [Lerista edwardsae]
MFRRPDSRKWCSCASCLETKEDHDREPELALPAVMSLCAFRSLLRRAEMALCNYSCSSVCGANTSCISQIPSSEVVIQPPCFKITIPGPVMSASPEPVAVDANTPCAPSSCHEPFGYGYGRRCDYGVGSGRWGCGSVCSSPYTYRGCY